MASRTVHRINNVCAHVSRAVAAYFLGRCLKQRCVNCLCCMCRWMPSPATLCVNYYHLQSMRTQNRMPKHWRKLKFDSNANSIKGFEWDATHIKIFIHHLQPFRSSLALFPVSLDICQPVSWYSWRLLHFCLCMSTLFAGYGLNRRAKLKRCTCGVHRFVSQQLPRTLCIWHKMSFGICFTILLAFILFMHIIHYIIHMSAWIIKT